MAKSIERMRAREMRREGVSIKVIAKNVGVSKSSVSVWCRDVELTIEQQNKLIEDDRKGGAIGRAVAAKCKIQERLDRVEKYWEAGRKLVGEMSERDLFVIGIALYWAEGCKKGRKFSFSNSDPKMIRLWIWWLEKCLKISHEDIVCCVGINQIHKYRIEDVEQFWSGVTGVPISSFTKASLKKVNSAKVYENPENHFGTLNVIVRKGTNDNYLMAGLIDGISGFEAGS
jgi:predicted transcriptional regulator